MRLLLSDDVLPLPREHGGRHAARLAAGEEMMVGAVVRRERYDGLLMLVLLARYQFWTEEKLMENKEEREDTQQ